jgi:hypothetical protein
MQDGPLPESFYDNTRPACKIAIVVRVLLVQGCLISFLGCGIDAVKPVPAMC